MIEQLFPTVAARKRLLIGPLAPHIERLAVFIDSQGYARLSVKQKLRLVAGLSTWLHRRQLPITALNEELVSQFMDYRRRRRFGRGSRATGKLLLSYLRSRDIIPPPTEVIDNSPLMRLEREYEQFLASERGLSPATLMNYLPTVRCFLTERFGGEPLVLDDLCPKDTHRFILRHADKGSRGRAQLMVTALRSFLRFLYQRGDITSDLASALPSVANWRLSHLPKSLLPEQVERLLASCDRQTAIGRRDFAILLLLARLGLRAGEVVALTLEDLDWEAGAFTVHGKGNRREQLPLPEDAGDALVDYLRHGRPPCTSRRVFIRGRAPHQGFSSSVAVCDVVRRALVRAGLNPPFKGAHLLRHSLATSMLRGGASLGEIGDILRHCRPETTQIYAKVDLDALRALTPPWPGGAL
jgi:site-specific recombinase XerD